MLLFNGIQFLDDLLKIYVHLRNLSAESQVCGLIFLPQTSQIGADKLFKNQLIIIP